MKHYVMTVEVKMQEMPELPEITEVSPDPLTALSNLGGKFLAAAPMMLQSPYVQPAGIDWRKGATITCGSFASVAKILEQFEELTNQISLERV